MENERNGITFLDFATFFVIDNCVNFSVYGKSGNIELRFVPEELHLFIEKQLYVFNLIKDEKSQTPVDKNIVDNCFKNIMEKYVEKLPKNEYDICKITQQAILLMKENYKTMPENIKQFNTLFCRFNAECECADDYVKEQLSQFLSEPKKSDFDSFADEQSNKEFSLLNFATFFMIDNLGLFSKINKYGKYEFSFEPSDLENFIKGQLDNMISGITKDGKIDEIVSLTNSNTANRFSKMIIDQYTVPSTEYTDDLLLTEDAIFQIRNSYSKMECHTKQFNENYINNIAINSCKDSVVEKELNQFLTSQQQEDINYQSKMEQQKQENQETERLINIMLEKQNGKLTKNSVKSIDKNSTTSDVELLNMEFDKKHQA